MKFFSLELAAVLAALGIGAVLVGEVHPPPMSSVLGSYSTDLAARTPPQRYNARRAAAAVDGFVIKSHGSFDFDDVLHGWTADQGFLKAPVSYDGTLVDDYGGGVCETSTTIYNAALLAGMTITERHQHSFSPSYAPPGRDAAVAYPTADLRFANPYPWPVTVHARPINGRLVCTLQALHASPFHIELESRILDRVTPVQIPTRPGNGMKRSFWQLQGRDGLRVVTYRTWYQAGALLRTEEVSDNTYLPISRVQWE